MIVAKSRPNPKQNPRLISTLSDTTKRGSINKTDASVVSIEDADSLYETGSENDNGVMSDCDQPKKGKSLKVVSSSERGNVKRNRIADKLTVGPSVTVVSACEKPALVKQKKRRAPQKRKNRTNSIEKNEKITTEQPMSLSEQIRSALTFETLLEFELWGQNFTIDEKRILMNNTVVLNEKTLGTKPVKHVELKKPYIIVRCGNEVIEIMVLQS